MAAKKKSIFFTDAHDPESYSLQNQFAENMEFRLAKDKTNYTLRDAYSTPKKTLKKCTICP